MFNNINIWIFILINQLLAIQLNWWIDWQVIHQFSIASSLIYHCSSKSSNYYIIIHPFLLFPLNQIMTLDLCIKNPYTICSSSYMEYLIFVYITMELNRFNKLFTLILYEEVGDLDVDLLQSLFYSHLFFTVNIIWFVCLIRYNALIKTAFDL